MEPVRAFVGAVLYLGVLLVLWRATEPPPWPLQSAAQPPAIRVAFVTIATRPTYFAMANDLMASLERHFCTGSKRAHYAPSFIVFSDVKLADTNLTLIYQEPLGWPEITLQRFEMLLGQKDRLAAFDFVYWLDADSLAVADFCEDILGERVGLAHMWYPNHSGYPYESSHNSKTFVSRDEERRNPYYSAHLYGGASPEFVRLLETCAGAIHADRRQGIIPTIHDESALNAYLVAFPPTLILTHSFTCFAEETYQKVKIPDDIATFSRRHKCIMEARWNQAKLET